MNLQTLLNKLETVNFNKSKTGKSISGLRGTNKVEVILTTKFSTTIIDMERMPIQIILSVKINDAFAITWGCENNEQNTEVLKFFTKKSVEAISKEMKREDEARGIAEIIFSTM